MAQLTNLYNADLLDRVSRANRPIKTEGFTKLTDKVAGMASDYAKDYSRFSDEEREQREAVKKKAQDKANSILEIGGSLDESWQDMINGQVVDLQDQYIASGNENNKLEQVKKMNNLNELSTQVQEVKDLNLEVAQYLSSKDVDNNLQSELDDEDLLTLERFQDPSTPKRINPETGELEVQPVVGMTDDDEEGDWISVSDIQNILDRNKRYPETELNLQKQIMNNRAVGAAGGPFDRNRQIATFKKEINEKNIRTVINDDVLGINSSFKKDFNEGIIQNINYAALDPKGFEASDVDPATGQKETNWYDVISEDDQQRLLDAIVNPRNDFYDFNFTQDLIANYMADKSEIEYNNAKETVEGKELDFWLSKINE